MDSDDLTVRVLVEIRDEIRTTNHRVDRLETTLGARIDALGTRVDALGTRVDELGVRMVDSEIRTSTAIHELHGTLRDVADSLKRRDVLGERVERCEREIDELKRRVS